MQIPDIVCVSAHDIGQHRLQSTQFIKHVGCWIMGKATYFVVSYINLFNHFRGILNEGHSWERENVNCLEP